MSICNEIIIDPAGNTYCGPLAQLFAIGKAAIPKTFSLGDSDAFHVFEVMPDGEVVHRAAQSTRRLAQSYMNPDRVCVYRK